MDFFSGSVDQCALGMIEKGAGIHVNPGGMMVTWFDYHCKREGLGSNPGVTLNFFEHWNSKQEVPSSNPGVTQVFFFLFCLEQSTSSSSATQTENLSQNRLSKCHMPVCA